MTPSLKLLVRLDTIQRTVRLEWTDQNGRWHYGMPFHATAQEWERAKAWTDPLKQICPAPMRHGQDEYRCTQCGHIWSIDEQRPPCDSTSET